MHPYGQEHSFQKILKFMPYLMTIFCLKSEAENIFLNIYITMLYTLILYIRDLPYYIKTYMRFNVVI